MKSLNYKTLADLLNGKIESDNSFSMIIKFYATSCSLCHIWHDLYSGLARKHESKKLHFCVFNYEKCNYFQKMAIEKLGIKGMPSFVLIRTGTSPVKIDMLPAFVDDPDPKTYYKIKDVEKLIRLGKNMEKINDLTL
jgi:thiol-disulfide isomerase/thioredoxin